MTPESDLKYARGTGPRVPPEQRPPSILEWIALIHAAVLVLWTSWAFGGAAEWMRPYFTWWGGLGILLTLTALQKPESWREGWMRPLWWLWPLVAFNLLVGLAALNPSLKEVQFGGETLLANTGSRGHLPSSARPGLAINALLLFDALWITSFNLALIVRQRRALRGLLLLVVGNAVVLSVFGTVQKLTQAKGIFFGAVPTRQTYFFSTFVYHNHWGAFALLALAAAIGLAWHYARRTDSRDFFHSPAPTALVALFLLAATIPLSGSRSCTLGLLALFGTASLHWLIRLVRQRRRRRESAAPPLLGALAAVALAAAGVWLVAGETIAARSRLTRSQVSTMIDQGGIGSRATLYQDTWRMARDKPWFGWGMESYPHVFHRLYNTQRSPVDRLPVFYRDAHSDWLQALAEHGVAGTALLALCAIVPLLRLRPRHLGSRLPLYLLIGCALVLLYAAIEFPFGNVAVVLTWWLCFFGAVQYARLQDRELPTPVRPPAAA